MGDLERDLERHAVTLAEAHDVPSIKQDKASRAWPDRVFYLGERRCFHVEFKRPGEEPRKQQWKKIRMLRSLGQRVYVIDDLETFARVLVAELNPQLYGIDERDDHEAVLRKVGP